MQILHNILITPDLGEILFGLVLTTILYFITRKPSKPVKKYFIKDCTKFDSYKVA